MHPAIVKCSLFADLPPAKIEDALRLMEGKIYSYKKGSMMLRVADRVSRFWLVLRGTVHVSLDEADGTHVIMASVSKGVYLSFAATVYRYACQKGAGDECPHSDSVQKDHEGKNPVFAFAFWRQAQRKAVSFAL